MSTMVTELVEVRATPTPRHYNKINVIVQGVLCLTNGSDDLVIADVEKAIGNLVVRFPLLHCEECAKTLKRWLKQRTIPGKIWRLSTQYDDEDFILSDRLEQQGCSESITENGVHYGVEVYGKIFDNLSRQGLSPEDWVQDFTSLSNQFKVEVIEEF
jgi:Papain fold toxin 2